MVIPVGDKSLVGHIETIDKLYRGGQKCSSAVFMGEGEKAIDSDDYNLARDEFELALLKGLTKSG